MSMPWFRLYAEFAGDPVVQSLAFEDQRHYIILLCLKCGGVLDRPISPITRREQIIARGLGLDLASSSEAKRRLQEVGLIDKNWQPAAWDKRQFKERHGVIPANPEGRAYIYFIGADSSEQVKIGYSKNPWARLKDFQTGTSEQLRILATVSTTENSEVHLLNLFRELRVSGEWHSRNEELNNLIKEIQYKRIKSDYDVVNYVEKLRTTTTDTDTDTDTELKTTTLASSEKISLSADGQWQNISPDMRAAWERAYPALSLDAELARAASWILANPQNRKKNYARFLTNWLSRAQDKAPRKHAGQQLQSQSTGKIHRAIEAVRRASGTA